MLIFYNYISDIYALLYMDTLYILVVLGHLDSNSIIPPRPIINWTQNMYSLFTQNVSVLHGISILYYHIWPFFH